MKLPAQSVSELRQVYHLSELRAPHDGIDIIVIPGLWAQGCPENESKTCSWLKLLLASTDHDTRVFIFMYDIDPGVSKHGSVWNQLLGLGRSLLDAARQARPWEARRRPLYFICHGLGGIILKQAVLLARTDYPHLCDALSGVVFLGTPHLTNMEDPRWDYWRHIMQLYRKDVPKTALRDEDKRTLVAVCNRFSTLNLPIPLLSVYESTETKVPTGPLNRFNLGTIGRKLVDCGHATIATSYEELIAADSPHPGLPVVIPGTALFRRLLDFFQKAPFQGKDVVIRAFDRLHLDYDIASIDAESRYAQTQGRYHDSPVPSSESSDNGVVKTRKVLLPCHILGQNRNRGFFGQVPFLSWIDDALRPSSEAPKNEDTDASDDEVALRAFAVCGMGGLGKTELVSEYVHKHKSDFEAIFWVNAADKQKLDVGFRNIAVRLGLQNEDSAFREDPEAVREVVKAWLSRPVRQIVGGIGDPMPLESETEVRWLLVFDNADEPDIVSDYWPPSGPGSILITSRNPLAKQDAPVFANLSGIDLPPMASKEAGKWLQALSKREQEESSVKTCADIADRMSGLPLAIVQMAHVIRTKHLSLSEFLESYDHDAKRLQNAPVRGLTRQQTVASIWNVESLSPPALSLLQVLSVMDPDNIAELILFTGASNVDLEEYPKDKFEYMEARLELITSSLVTRNIEAGFLRIHRLVQDVVRQKLTPDQLRSVFDAATHLLTDVWPFFKSANEFSPDRLRTVQGFLPHISAFRQLVEDKTVSKLRPQIRVSALFNEVAWYYILQSWGYNLRFGFRLAQLSEEALRASDAENDENTFSQLLANSYRYQAITSIYMLEAETAISGCKKWIETLVERIAKYKYDVDTKTLPIAYNELGIALLTLPDEIEAITAFTTCCDMLTQQREPDKLPFPFAWQHKASVLANSGHADAAYEILAPVLKEREEAHGRDSTDNIEDGHLLTYLGNIRRLQGEKDWYDYEKRAVALLRVTCGENASFTIQASYRLARAHFERADYEEAVTLLRKCVAFPGDVPWYRADLGRYCWKLGRTLQAMGQHGSEASILLEKSVAIRHEIAPEDKRPENELVDADWDKHIYILYR